MATTERASAHEQRVRVRVQGVSHAGAAPGLRREGKEQAAAGAVGL